MENDFLFDLKEEGHQIYRLTLSVGKTKTIGMFYKENDLWHFEIRSFKSLGLNIRDFPYVMDCVYTNEETKQMLTCLKTLIRSINDEFNIDLWNGNSVAQTLDELSQNMFSYNKVKDLLKRLDS